MLSTHARPGSEARAYLVYDTHWLFRLDGDDYRWDASRDEFHWEAGGMYNVTPRTALGATLMNGTRTGDDVWGLRLRCDHWLDNRWLLSAGPGLDFDAFENGDLAGHWSGRVAASYRGWIGLALFAETHRVETQTPFAPWIRGGPVETRWYLSAFAGNEPSLIGGMIIPFALLYIALSTDDS